MKMYRLLFFISALNWLIFAYDMQYHRDFLTWMWLGVSIFFLSNAFAGYIIEKLKADMQQLLEETQSDKDAELNKKHAEIYMEEKKNNFKFK